MQLSASGPQQLLQSYWHITINQDHSILMDKCTLTQLIIYKQDHKKDNYFLNSLNTLNNQNGIFDIPN
ncbi:unnamed protein product [Paramecium octaurelia]|uniref:Uncharacterized protein n=1 Tax=Paramecium octaurelia TaxID=43137 RepID=A0A8S1UJM5_PAROT|nr:unnamed protein product [Paramecium octaurelia]